MNKWRLRRLQAALTTVIFPTPLGPERRMLPVPFSRDPLEHRNQKLIHSILQEGGDNCRKHTENVRAPRFNEKIDFSQGTQTECEPQPKNWFRDLFP